MQRRWKELKKAVIQSAEQQHLCRRKRPMKPWILQDTLKLIEAKIQAFVEWQNERTDMDRRRKYVIQCKQVSWALKCDREQRW